jgi:hypothetical protein
VRSSPLVGRFEDSMVLTFVACVRVDASKPDEQKRSGHMKYKSAFGTARLHLG